MGTAPPNITQPNDGFIDPPNLQPLSASDLVCGLDGLTYHPDGRLYIQRNETDNSTTYELCDFHLNVTSGCLFISTHEQSVTLFGVGDPTVDNITINIIHPTGTKWYRFDIRSVSDYALAATSGFTADPAGDYGLVAYPTSTNCTVGLPDPLPKPQPPGLSCSTLDTALKYRPSDNYPSVTEALNTAGIAEAPVYFFLDGDLSTVLEYDGVLFEPLAGEAQAVTCTIDAIPGLTCLQTDKAYTQCDVNYTTASVDYSTPQYNGRFLHPLLPNGTCYAYNGRANFPLPTTDFSGTCNTVAIDDALDLYSSSSNAFACRYNRLRFKSYNTWASNEDVLFESMLDSMPLQTFDLLDTEVPCTYTIEDDFFCDAFNHSWATYVATSYPLYYALNNTPPYIPLPCFNNSRQLPTLCRDVELNYTDGRSVHVRLEGQHLTYTVNGVEQDLACDIYKAQDAGTMDMASVLQGYHTQYKAPSTPTPDINGSYWKGRIRANVQRVRASLNMVHLTATGDPYAKDAFLCCLADTVRHLIRFILTFFFEWAKFFRSIMALPAYFNDIEAFEFDMPTFRTAKDEFREAVCRLACTITRILPDIFNCSSLEGEMGCGSTATCATGLLCHIADVPLLLLEVVVEILETIRSLVRDDEDNTNNELNNEYCQQGHPIECMAGMIIYIVIKVIFTLTQVGRDLGAFFSCFFCGIGTLLGLGDDCSAIFYDFIKSLMDLIDGLTDTILKTLIKIIISIVSFFIYLFSGTDNAFTLAIEQLGNIFIYLGEMLLNLGQLILEFIMKIPVIGSIVRFIVNLIGEVCGIVQDVVSFFTEPNVDIGCPPVDWEALKKRGVQGTVHWLMNVKPAVLATWDNELPVCRARMTQLNNTAYEELTDVERLDVFFCLFADHWIHEIEPQSSILATVCEQQVLDFYDQRVLWSQLVGRVNRAEVQWCGRMRFAMHQLRVKGGYDYVPENLLDNPLLFIGFGVQMLYGYDVFAQYNSDRSLPMELITSSEYASNWQATGFGTAHLTELAALPNDEARRVALATDDPALGLELEQYATRMSSVFQFKASALSASARFWGRMFGQEPLYPAASLKRTALPVPAQSILVQFLNFTVRTLAKQQVLPPPRIDMGVLTRANETVRNRQYLNLGMRAIFKDGPIILSQTAVRAIDTDLGGKALRLGMSIPRQFYAGTMAVFKILGDVTSGRSNPLSAAWARQRPKESLQYAMNQVGNAASVPMAHLGKGPGQLFQLTSSLWSVSPVARSVRQRLAYVGSAMAYSIQTAGRGEGMSTSPTDLVCEIPFTALCEECGVLAVPLGTLIMAPTQAVQYYVGANDTDPSYGHSYAAYLHLRELLNDKSMPAEIGDSADNSVRWPYYDRSQYAVLGDTTPNKGRLVNLTTIFWDVVDGLFAAETMVATVNTGMTQAVRVFDGTLDHFFGFYRALWDARSTKQVVAKTTRVAVSALGGSLVELVHFFTSWFKSCRYRDELNGSQKQFAIAEGLALLFVSALVAGLVINLFIPSSTMSLFAGILGMFSVSTLVGLPLMISYFYTPSCFPAMPYQAPDDVVWAITRTIVPACDFFWSGIITNDTYDNVQCRQCDNYDDDTGYVAAACFDPSTTEDGVGFQHFGKNIGFTLLHYFPDLVQSWNNTNWPVLGTLIQTQLVQSFFTGFENYNASDAISFSVHWSCNAVHTALPNYYIILPVFSIIKVAMPLAMVALSLIYGSLPVAYWLIQLGDAAQAGTLKLAMLAGEQDKPRLPSQTMASELVYMSRYLGRRAQLTMGRFGQGHRNLYYRY